MKKFARTLKTLRTGCDVTQEKLAKDLGISRSTIGMYETGEREPDFATAERIADYFKVNVDTLLGRQISQEKCDRWDEENNLNGEMALYVKMEEIGRGGGAKIVHNNQKEIIKNLFGSQIADVFDMLTKMNDSGKDEVVKRIQQLSRLPEYAAVQDGSSSVQD